MLDEHFTSRAPYLKTTFILSWSRSHGYSNSGPCVVIFTVFKAKIFDVPAKLKALARSFNFGWTYPLLPVCSYHITNCRIFNRHCFFVLFLGRSLCLHSFSVMTTIQLTASSWCFCYSAYALHFPTTYCFSGDCDRFPVREFECPWMHQPGEVWKMLPLRNWRTTQQQLAGWKN